MAVVRFEDFLESFNRSYAYCVAKVQERKYGRALELLNASIKDKTFDRNVSNALGVSVNMSIGNWSDYSARGAASSGKESLSSKITTST
jgi:hypothetical protein